MIVTTPAVIMVTGNIAAGKSTFAAWLAQALSLPCYLERPDENPFFFDPTASAFHAQLHFLAESLESYTAIANRHCGGVQERTPHEQVDVFAQARHDGGWISGSELDLLKRLARAVLPNMGDPDLLIYLDADPATLLQRIRHRGRSAEAEVDIAYLDSLARLYEMFLQRWVLCPVMRIDTNLSVPIKDEVLDHIVEDLNRRS